MLQPWATPAHDVITTVNGIPFKPRAQIKPRVVSVGLADGEPGDWATGKNAFDHGMLILTFDTSQPCLWLLVKNESQMQARGSC